MRHKWTSILLLTEDAKEDFMSHAITLEYWRDGQWFVGRLVEVPSVFSQGVSVEELRENMQDAYDLCVTQEHKPNRK